MGVFECSKTTQTQWFINKSVLKQSFWDKPKSYIAGSIWLHPHYILISSFFSIFSYFNHTFFIVL